MDIIINIILWVLLIITSVQDSIHKKISIWIIIAGAILICPFIWFSTGTSIIERVFGIMIGVGVIVLSKATRGKIGIGDGLVLCVTGLALGFWRNMELFALALFIASILSIILLAFRAADRKKSIPFIPFMLFGYTFLCFM